MITAQDPSLDAPADGRASRDGWYPGSFLLTDIVGSVALWERDEAAMSRATARHDDIVKQEVSAAGGELVSSQGEGDSTFSVFTHPANAIAAARNIQSSIAAEAWPTPEPLASRWGPTPATPSGATTPGTAGSSTGQPACGPWHTAARRFYPA